MSSYKLKKLKVKLRKVLHVYSKKLLSDNVTLTPIQEKMVGVARSIINKKGAKLLIAPLSGGCYAEYTNYYLHLGNTFITIKTPNFTWYTGVDYKTGEKLTSFFYSKVEQHRKEMEQRSDLNTLNNLESILKAIR